MELIENFVRENFIFIYMTINLIFYLFMVKYRIKYFNGVLNKYDKSVEDDKPATIVLAAYKLLIVVALLLKLIVEIIIYCITFGFYKGRSTVINLILAIFVLFISVSFAIFPLILFTSFLAIFGDYSSEQLDSQPRG